MDLEKNNINAQVSLMDDIINNDDHIIYHLGEKAKEVFDIITSGKHSNDNASVTLTKESFDKTVDILRIMFNKDQYEKLGSLAKSAVPDNKIKKEILKMLQKS